MVHVCVLLGFHVSMVYVVDALLTVLSTQYSNNVYVILTTHNVEEYVCQTALMINISVMENVSHIVNKMENITTMVFVNAMMTMKELMAPVSLNVCSSNLE